MLLFCSQLVCLIRYTRLLYLITIVTKYKNITIFESVLSDRPDAVPPPTPLEKLVNQPEYTGGVWLLVELDLNRIDTRPVRLNVSLPSNLVQQIDAWAEAHHMTRSGFLASAVKKAMAARS